MFRTLVVFLCLVFFLLGTGTAGAQGASGYVHFEARLTHPIALTPDGTRLLVVNAPEARLSVFDVSGALRAAPALIAEIPVGLEPVSVKARTNEEVWVVNEVSDTISIVSLTHGVTVATLAAGDEPADIAFAQGKAFVTCSRNSVVRVFDVETREETAVVPLDGDSPRALAVSSDGGRVFAAFQLSGNRTTTLPPALAPLPPPPENPLLPAAPRTGLVVAADDARVPYTVLDHDVAEIGVTENRVYAYYSDVGTNVFDLVPSPDGTTLWVANTDALNLTRFEPALRGNFVRNRVTRLAIPQGTVTAHDLNPGVSQSPLPNPDAQALALAQPCALVLTPDGTHLWVAAFGSDRLARVATADGAVLDRIDLRPAGDTTPGMMRGPRGLCLHPTAPLLYAYNKLSHTLSIVDTTAPASSAVVAEVSAASHHPMPDSLRVGRALLFDARLSGNGSASCASCHLDADRDGLAWDLGDPSGSLVTVIGRNNSIHDTTPRPRVLHPMKGPMTTQTLRGLQGHVLFHWRGDRPSVQSFGVTFRDLMGGEVPSAPDLDALAAYLLSLRHHPNPNRNLDRSLPSVFGGGNPIRGRDLYNDHPKSHCVTCHALPTGSDENIDLMAEVGSSQPLKTVPLRTVYQRSRFDGRAGAVNVTGYGLLHDGTGFQLPRAHFYVLDALDTLQELADVTAFLMCFDTGTAPVVGHSVTLAHPAAPTDSQSLRLDTLEAQAAVTATSDLIVRGRLRGRWGQWLFEPVSRTYIGTGTTTPGLTREEMVAALTGGDALTFLGVPPAQGARLGFDRDQDSRPDSDEPLPYLTLESDGPRLLLSWPENFADWSLESRAGIDATWQPAGLPAEIQSGRWRVRPPFLDGLNLFRLRRTW